MRTAIAWVIAVAGFAAMTAALLICLPFLLARWWLADRWG